MRTPEIGAIQIGAIHIRIAQVRVSDNGTYHRRIYEIRCANYPTNPIVDDPSTAQIGVIKPGLGKVSF
jgi:hypothetical protein